MPRKHKREQGIETASIRPGWINCGDSKDGEIFTNELLGELYRWYVIETPCELLSSSSKPVNNWWGSKPWSSKGNRLYGRLFTDLGFVTNTNLFIGTSTSETKALFKDAGMNAKFSKILNEERIAIYHNQESQFLSVAYHIRSSLAHGRFAVVKRNEVVYVAFEDGRKYKESFNVRARLFIKYSTLTTGQ